jgi:glycerophosphoryl diester phosphodiesterase
VNSSDIASPRPLVIGHRGTPVQAPEQTFASFERAVRFGADMIEVDVRVSADDVLVLLHDQLLDRTTNGTGPVGLLTADELRALDAGSWFAPEFAGQRIPLLDELFDFAERENVALCLEAKGKEPGEQLRLTRRLADEIDRRGRVATDLVSSFDHEALGAAVKHLPELRVAPDRLPERGLSTAAELIAQARDCGASVIQHYYEDLLADVVAEVQAAGIAVWAWPATSESAVADMIEIGVAGIMGDDVETITRLLAARA